jgi:hypothetical protein
MIDINRVYSADKYQPFLRINPVLKARNNGKGLRVSIRVIRTWVARKLVSEN